MKHNALYPLRFKEILRDYRFGDRWIVREFEKVGLPDDHRVGETWEGCDRPGESSEIINGPLAGRTLGEAIAAHGPALLGTRVAERFGSVFPLLIKFLDATHTLSAQVHTDDELTRLRQPEERFGKTEAWYMLRTVGGAKVFAGNRPGVTAEGLVEAVLADRAASCMAEYAAAPGDGFLLYAGTMHYSPGGLLFYEIMQNSDVYVGLRPAGGAGETQKRRAAVEAVEAVHLEEPFDCRTRPVSLADGPNRRTFAIVCEHFAVERLDLTAPADGGADPSRFHVLTVIAGRVKLHHAGGSEELFPGHTALIPAGAAAVRMEPIGSAALLKAYVPDLAADVIGPLRAAGIADEAIAALGGRTRLNPLPALL